MNVRAVTRVILALIVASPAALAAQSGPVRPGALRASLGVGAGRASFTCDACSARTDGGISALLRVGMGVRANLALGAEVSGWTSEYDDPRGTGTARVVFGQFVAQWYPMAAVSGAFVKAAGGVASIRDEIAIDAVGPTIVTTHSPALGIGLGWDVPVARRWLLSPYADLSIATKAHQTVNSEDRRDRLGATLVLFGVAATVR